MRLRGNVHWIVMLAVLCLACVPSISMGGEEAEEGLNTNLVIASAASGWAGLALAGASTAYYLNGLRAYRAYESTSVYGDVSRYRKAAINYERLTVITGCASAAALGASTALLVMSLDKSKPEEKPAVMLLPAATESYAGLHFIFNFR